MQVIELKQHTRIIVAVIAGVLFAAPVFAQGLEFGLEYAEGIGLPEYDIISMITGFLRALMGFLGLWMVLQIMYGGLLVMTSGGSADQHEQGMATIKNSAIGFFLIMSASSIAKFVVGAVVNATTGTMG